MSHIHFIAGKIKKAVDKDACDPLDFILNACINSMCPCEKFGIEFLVKCGLLAGLVDGVI